MKKIKELVGLLGKRHLPLDDTKSGRQAHQLYLYVRRVAEPTDHGGAKKLKLPKSSSAYRKAKHRLKYALLDGITAVSPHPPIPANRPEASLRCWSSIALAKSNQYAYDLLPRELIDADIQLSQEYDLLEASSQLTDILADRPSVGPDIVHYLERSDYLGELGVAMAEVYDSSFHITVLRNDNEKGGVISEFALSNFKCNLKKVKAFDNGRMYFHIACMNLHHLLAISKYQSVVDWCKEMKSVLQTREFIGKSNAINVVNINLLNAYTQIKKFEEGEEIAINLLRTIPKTKKNYAKVQESLILLCLRTGEFQAAYRYFHKYNVQSIENNVSLYFSETVEIFKAYIHLFIRLNLVSPSVDESSFMNFRVSRFLNSFNFADKEKSTRNIQIVVIKFIFQLLNYELVDPINTALAVEKYADRHLKRPDRKRSFFFLKGLIYLANFGFTPTNVERAREKYTGQLSILPILGAHHHSNLEVVDYYILFEEVCRFILNEKSASL